MSLRTVLQCGLVAILTLIVVGPGAAQVPNPWRDSKAPAPMPRMKVTGIEIEFGIELGSGSVLNVRGPGSIVLGPSAAPLEQMKLERVQGEFELFIDGIVPPRPATGPAFGHWEPLLPQSRTTNLNEMNFTWQYNVPPTLQHQAVPMPRMIVEIIGVYEVVGEGPSFRMGSYQSPRMVFVPAPAMTPHGRTCPTAIASDVAGCCNSPAFAATRVVPANPVGAQQSRMAQGQVTAGGNGSGGWWVNECPVPQPGCALDGFQSCCPPQFVRPAVVHRIHPGTVVAAPVPTAPVASVPPGKLTGTWYREIEGLVLAATFHGDELKLCMTQCENETTVCFTLTADYAVTKEGLVHGVVTGVDVDVKRDPKRGEGGTRTGEMAAELQSIVDCPFSFRIKQTSSGIMVSNLKVAVEGMDKKSVAIVCGMFKPAPAGRVPVAKSVQSLGGGKTHFDGPALCRYTEVVEAVPYPVAGPVPPMAQVGPMQPPTMTVPTMPTPVPPGVITTPEDVIRQIKEATGWREPSALPTPVQPWVPERMTGSTGRSGEILPARLELAPAKPANIPAGEFGMMADIFGQMFGGQSTAASSLAPLPKATYLNHPPQYYPPPAPTSTPRMVEPPAPPMPVPTLPVIERPTGKKKPPTPEVPQSPFGNFIF